MALMSIRSVSKSVNVLAGRTINDVLPQKSALRGAASLRAQSAVMPVSMERSAASTDRPTLGVADKPMAASIMKPVPPVLVGRNANKHLAGAKMFVPIPPSAGS